MITTIFDKVSLLVSENNNSSQEVCVSNYDIKCNNKIIYSFDYELTTDEESMLDFIYHADDLGFGEEIGKLMQQKINLSIQKQFFTKLFIYEKLSELEDDFYYTEYVTKLNTGSHGQDSKSVEELLDIYGSTFLKTDKEFRKTMKTFKQMKMTTNYHNLDVVPTKIKLRTEEK